MLGVKTERVGDTYKLEFDSYDTMLQYLHRNRPAQFNLCFDGETLTGSKPVATPKVDKEGIQ